jgi:3-oxoacyl-[acyl-carrier-protein] synthase-3
VLDVKNACNSFLNGVQVGEALVATGQCEVALVVTGEIPSRVTEWRVESACDFRRRFAGFTMGDAGAAAVLARAATGAGSSTAASPRTASTGRSPRSRAAARCTPRARRRSRWTARGSRTPSSRTGPAFLARSLCEAGVGVDDFARHPRSSGHASVPRRDVRRHRRARDRVEVTADTLGQHGRGTRSQWRTAGLRRPARSHEGDRDALDRAVERDRDRASHDDV